MRFRVHGADPETGHDLSVELEAATLSEARRRAFDMGMLVSKVELIGDAPTASVPPSIPANTPPESQPDRVMTIERTSKKWKKVQLVGAGIFFLSMVSCMSASSMRENGDIAGAESTMKVAALGMLIGPVVWLYGRLSAWWHHG